MKNSLTPEEISGVRNKFRLTQKDFANLLGTTRDSIQSWELRTRYGKQKSKPSGVANKILIILANEKTGPRLFKILKSFKKETTDARVKSS